MTNQHVLLNVAGGVATVILNDPARFNPLSIPLQNELTETLRRVHADESVRVLVLTGAGRGFCAGADLMAINDSADESMGASTARMMEALTNPLITALRDMPMPVLSVVAGPAAGAGVGLALAADVVLAGDSAYFYLPFMPALGIVPDVGLSWFLPRLVGRARSSALMLLGDRLSARQAEAWGLIWRCVGDGELASERDGLCERLAALPRHAAMEIRRAIDLADRQTLNEQLDYERSRQRDLVDGPCFAEGLQAFKDKRKPTFV